MAGFLVPVKRPSSLRKDGKLRFRKTRKSSKLSSRDKHASSRQRSSSSSFPKFSLLPTEIRLRIWGFFANSNPRTLDIWSDYSAARQGNASFYFQKYACHLANKAPHPVLGVCHESREEGLKHFTLEYKTVFPHSDIKYESPARFYINYASDTLVPRGYWNIIGFGDFKKRNWGRLRNLAVDVSGRFWRDQVMNCVNEKTWAFEGLENLVLYDTSMDGAFKDEMFGDSDRYESLQKRWDGRKKVLSFGDVHGEGKRLEEGVEKLLKYFKQQNGETEEAETPTVVGGESASDIDTQQVGKKTEFDVRKGAQLTQIQLRRLVVA